MEYLKSYSYHEMDRVLENLESINESQLTDSLNKSDDKLGWYKRLLTKIKTMKFEMKNRILAIVIPLLLSGGISQGAVLSTTNSIDNDIAIEQYMDMDEGEQDKSGYQVYYDTTFFLKDGTPDKIFEKVVEHNGTDIYFMLNKNKRGVTQEILVTLNGNEIFKDIYSQLLGLKVFDSTITANKGDIFKVEISDGGFCWLDVKMSADINTGIKDMDNTKLKVYLYMVRNYQLKFGFHSKSHHHKSLLYYLMNQKRQHNDANFSYQHQ